MNDWLISFIIIAALALIIGSLSTFQKSSKMPLRKKSLNDLKETIPRSTKAPTKTMHSSSKSKNSD